MGWEVLPHAEYTQPIAAFNTVPVSSPRSAHHTAVWCVNTRLKGLWCDADNTFWGAGGGGAGYPQQDIVMKLELEPCNGVCGCHAIDQLPWPQPDPHSLLAVPAVGPRQLAGHIDRVTADEFASSGLRALLSAAAGVRPACQLLAITEGHNYYMGAGPLPCGVGLRVYVFGEPSPVFTAAMTALQQAMQLRGAPQPQMNPAVPLTVMQHVQ